MNNNDDYFLIQQIQMYEYELEDLKRDLYDEQQIKKCENKIKILKQKLIDLKFMEIAINVSKKSICQRKKVGCVIVKNNEILASDYNHPPLEKKLCEYGCLKEIIFPNENKYEVCNAIHAEVNTIIDALKNGKNLKGSTIYLTLSPCLTCTKLIIESGIKKIIYKNIHNDFRVFDMCEKYDVIIEKLNKN